jgi:hypothetical protein
MDGFATTICAEMIRKQGDEMVGEDFGQAEYLRFLADELEQEYRDVCAARDRARALAVAYEAEIHRATSAS